MRFFVLCIAALVLCSCQSDSGSSAIEEMNLRDVNMPNGKVIRAEVMIRPADLQRGMMFRDSLPSGRGMLFLHKQPSNVSYWMYQVKIPLDIVFIDSSHKVLGVSVSAPPCTTRASECPQYGGYPGTQYVLELGGGEAAKYGVQPGTVIGF